MNDGYDGVEVMDRGGAGVGKVERTYIDDSGSPRYIEVKFGTLLPRHRLVPAAAADLTDAGVLQVAYDKETIERSPDAPDSDTLEPADLERIDAYYEGFENCEVPPSPPREPSVPWVISYRGEHGHPTESGPCVSASSHGPYRPATEGHHLFG